MGKKAVSVTLEVDNLRWLQGQATATKSRGLSETLDRLVTSARLGGRVHEQSVRSVVGTLEINPDDPGLDRADEYLQTMVDASIARPFVARSALAGRARGGRPRVGKRRRHG